MSKKTDRTARAQRAKAHKKSARELGARIAKARESAGFKTQTALANELKVTRGAVSQWEGGVSSPDSQTLADIAIITKTNYEWLATGRESSDPPMLAVVGARVIGLIEADIWREGQTVLELVNEKIAPESDTRPLVPAVMYPWAHGLHQWAFQNRGTSMDKTIHDGEYAICVAYRDARPSGPVDGDLVVIEQRRPGEYKNMIMRLCRNGVGWELRHESNEKRWSERKPIKLNGDLSRGQNGNGPIEIEIIAYVAGIYRDTTLPTRPVTLSSIAGALGAFSLTALSIIGAVPATIIIAVAVMIAGNFLIEYLTDPYPFFAASLLPVILTALRFGLGAALVPTMTSDALAWYALYEPKLSWAPPSSDGAFFEIVCFTVIAISIAACIAESSIKTRLAT